MLNSILQRCHDMNSEAAAGRRSLETCLKYNHRSCLAKKFYSGPNWCIGMILMDQHVASNSIEGWSGGRSTTMHMQRSELWTQGNFIYTCK